AARRGDAAFAERCRTGIATLRAALEQHAWDGEWYRRAYFDDGTPLGTHTGVECQIDSIAQSWSVLSGIASRERAQRAMNSLFARLVSLQQRIVRLLDPPFNGAGLNFGYIAGYVSGVRENGGQYTHGAIWSAMAFAQLGDAARAWQVMDLINPIHHGSTPAQVATYKVEPYVVAADVYSVAPHTGRGGWSWYTGSAGWMYRLLIETLLGAHLEGDRLRLIPRMPAAWNSYKMHYRYRQTVYHITFTRLAADSG